METIFDVGLGPLIFGITMFIGGVLAFYLPESNGRKVPETIQEANDFPGERYDDMLACTSYYKFK